MGQSLHAINPTDPLDPNCILAVDMKDGRGGVARDLSKSGLDMTLNGAAAWLEETQIFADWRETLFSVRPASLTYAPLYGHAVYLTATAGIDLTTNVTTKFDFSGNKPFMWAIIISDYSIGFDAGQVSIFNWSQGANSCGLSLEITGGANQTLNLNAAGIGTMSSWNIEYGRDTKPHMIGFWRDEAGHTDAYYDGKLVRSNSSIADMNTCGGGSAMNIGKAKTGAAGEMGGIVGPFWWWDKTVERNNAPGFFKAWLENQSF